MDCKGAAETKKEDMPIACFDYKCNKKKTLILPTTKGAGCTGKGKTLDVWDKYGNFCVWHVSRPLVIS